nr:polyprotein [Broad bean wilt virus 2]WDY35250.1 polyprotein [Broad bean wilt virus 2]WDY35251.1 polyprotein [Broad bean wilt virus 2]
MNSELIAVLDRYLSEIASCLFLGWIINFSLTFFCSAKSCFLLWAAFLYITYYILRFEFAYIVAPFLKTIYSNSSQYYTVDWENAYTALPKTLWEQITDYNYCFNFPKPIVEGFVSDFSPRFTLEELVAMNEANITPVHTIPRETLLKRASDYKLAVESKKSILPKVQDLYEMDKWHALKSRLNKNAPSYVVTSEIAVGAMSGAGNVKLALPVVEKYTEEVADDRLPDKVRAKADQIMVAAIELVADGFASVNSDVTMAGALYDKRHKTIASSFKGAFASRASGVPSHVIYYPMHRVPSSDDPNTTLELSMVSRDSDFDEGYTLANISARTLYVRAKGPEKVTETRHLLKAKTEDVVKAQQFASEAQVVFATPRLFPEVNLDNYNLPGPSNVQQTEAITTNRGILFPKPKFKGNEVVLNYTGPTKVGNVSVQRPGEHEFSSKPYVGSVDDLGCLSDEDGKDYRYGQGLMEEDVLNVQTNNFAIESATETMRLLFSGFASIPLNVTPGTKLTVAYLNELSKHSAVHTGLLNMLSKIPGSLKVKINCQVAPTCGIGLAISYVEGNESANLGSSLGRLLGIQHYKWNPAIEPYVEFVFKPFSCADWWNMHYLGSFKYAPVMVVQTLSKWLNAPKVDAKMSFAIYYEPSTILPKQIATLDHAPAFMFRKELGTLAFKQGERVAYSFEVNFGKPQTDGKEVTSTFASSYCGLSQYMQSDVILDFTLMSSPMIGGTFSIAYVAGAYIEKVGNMQILDSLPHVDFTFSSGSKSTRSVRFPKEVFGVHQALDRWDLDSARGDDVSGNFVIYQRDAVSSALEGELTFRIAARLSGDINFVGVSAGYPTTITRIGKGKAQGRSLDPEIRKPLRYMLGQSHSTPQDFSSVRFVMGRWKYKAGLYPGSKSDEDIHPYSLKMRLDGSKSSENFEIIHSPFVRLLQNCAWMKGILKFYVVARASSDYMSYRRTSQLTVSAHENSLSSNQFYSGVLTSPSGEIGFSREVVGPVDGFASMGWNVRGSKKFYKIHVEMGNVHEYDTVMLYGQFGLNVEFAGQQKGGHYLLEKETPTFKAFKY